MADSEPVANYGRTPATFPSNAMSHQYQAIAWNRQKRLYDIVMVVGVALYLTLFVGVSAFLFPSATRITLTIRAVVSAAFFLLHIVLCIGPLCRLDPKFLPLLYNRRHLGIVTFLLGGVHSVAAIRQYPRHGNKDPLVSLLISNLNFRSLPDFPFQQLGFLALI